MCARSIDAKQKSSSNETRFQSHVFFMLGHVIKEDDLTRMWAVFSSERVEWVRDRYVQVKKRFFT